MLKCNKCEQEKEESEFYKNEKARTGYDPRCKACGKIAQQQRRQASKKPKPPPETYEQFSDRKLKEFKSRNKEQQRLEKEKEQDRIAKRRKLNSKSYKEAPIENIILWRAKARAKKQKVPFNLTVEDIRIPDICPILGIPIYRSKKRNNSPSIDRIIPEYGYIKNNIQIISNRANLLKSNASPDELILFANWILKFFKRKCYEAVDTKEESGYALEVTSTYEGESV